MANGFSLSRSNTALSTTNDHLTIIGAVSRMYVIVQVTIGGMATASVANELGVFRSTAGTTPGGAITSVPLQTNQSAAGFTNATTWSVQPTLGNCAYRIPVNANGGLMVWSPKAAGIIIPFLGTEQLSFRSVVGTSLVTFTVFVEEY